MFVHLRQCCCGECDTYYEGKVAQVKWRARVQEQHTKEAARAFVRGIRKEAQEHFHRYNGRVNAFKPIDPFTGRT